MSQATSFTSSVNAEDFALGSKLISYAMRALTWGIAAAIAWSCSTLVMGIVMFIITALFMSLLTALLHVVLLFKLPTTSIEGIGAFAGRAASRATSLFSRKVAV